MQQAAEAIGGRVRAEERGLPRHLRWTDPESGERLSVEVWGQAFADELLALGFEVDPGVDDETAGSLCVVIRVRGPGPTA